MSAIQVDNSVSLNDIMVLSEMQAKTRYNLGTNNLINTANEAGAIVPLGKRKYGYLREVLDDYFRSKAI